MAGEGHGGRPSGEAAWWRRASLSGAGGIYLERKLGIGPRELC